MKNYLIAVIAAASVGFWTHVYLSDFISQLVSSIMESRASPNVQQTYGAMITSLAAVTSIFPAFGMLIFIKMIKKTMALSNPILQGCVVSALYLLIEGELLRQPIMNFVIGSPINVVLLEVVKSWSPRIAMCIVLSSILEWKFFIPSRFRLPEQKSDYQKMKRQG